jgi:hypothetical protein
MQITNDVEANRALLKMNDLMMKLMHTADAAEMTAIDDEIETIGDAVEAYSDK